MFTLSVNSYYCTSQGPLQVCNDLKQSRRSLRLSIYILNLNLNQMKYLTIIL